MRHRELGDEAGAEAGFRKVFLMSDDQMAYHLTRLALARADQ
jgi:hypothetical protein